MELGGNIVLEGFDEKEFTELIVVKKIVGQYARQFTDTKGKVDKLVVTLTPGEKQTVSITLSLDGKEHTSEASAGNLYMALDASLRDIANKLV